MPNVRIGEGARIYRAIIGEGAVIEAGVTIGSPDDSAITVIAVDQYRDKRSYAAGGGALMKHKVMGVINLIHETDELEAINGGPLPCNCALWRTLPLNRFCVVQHGQFRHLEGRSIRPYEISFAYGSSWIR